MDQKKICLVFFRKKFISGIDKYLGGVYIMNCKEKYPSRVYQMKGTWANGRR